MSTNPPAIPLFHLGETSVLEAVHESKAATVYRGLRGEQSVACKVYAADRSAKLDERVRRECVMQADIEHPCLSPLIQWGESPEGAAYAISQWVDGRTLRARLREGPMSWPELRPIALDVARALSAVHGAKTVHRDVKPSNIMICEGAEETRAVLLDFGHALMLDEIRLTDTGKVLGTPAYMAPEQALGGTLDGRADLYGLGAVMYEALTGERVFSGASVAAILKQHTSHAVTPPRERAPALDIPQAADDLVLWLLEKDPADRVPNARVLFHALSAAPA
ncbi:MAG: serine/threonine-protein kinase [Myxococcota bacterium]